MSNKGSTSEQRAGRLRQPAVWITLVAFALTCGAQPPAATSAPVDSPATTTAPADQPPLERLAAEVAIRLADENGSTYPGDPRGWTDDPYLHLARDWPHSAFLEPLKHLLRHKNAAIALEAAEGLLKYRQPALREAVSALADDKRRIGDQTLGTLIRARLAEPGDPIGFADDPQWLAPPADQPNPTMTIPAAEAALSDRSLNVRVQAFRWLALRGIVLTTAPLEESWLALTDEQRLRLLQDCAAGPSHCGLEELRAAAERLAKGDWVSMSSIETRRAMLELLADVDAPIVRDFVTGLLTRGRESQFEEDVATVTTALGPAYGDALSGFAAEWRAPDCDLAVRWTRGAHEHARWKGVVHLVRSRDALCVQRAIDELWSLSGRKRGSGAITYAFRLMRFVPQDERVYWHWAHAFNAMLQLRVKWLGQDDRNPEDAAAGCLLRELDTVLGRLPGGNDFAENWNDPMKFGVSLLVDRELLRKHAAERNRWIIENDPGDEP
ncbi:MAG: hypothetical protein PVJ57_23160 [Phycisphaerae bacterium]